MKNRNTPDPEGGAPSLVFLPARLPLRLRLVQVAGGQVHRKDGRGLHTSPPPGPCSLGAHRKLVREAARDCRSAVRHTEAHRPQRLPVSPSSGVQSPVAPWGPALCACVLPCLRPKRTVPPSLAGPLLCGSAALRRLASGVAIAL